MRRESPALASRRVEHPVLVWARPHGASIEFPVDSKQTFTIGRDASSNIVLPSTFVSRAHARLQYRDGKYLIEDLGSANGTKVNGSPVSISVVEPGDTIEFGSERLEFREGGARAGGAAASGAGKTVRLAVVAIASLLVMGGILMMLRPSPPPSAKRPAAATDRAAPTAPSTPSAAAAPPAATLPPPTGRSDSGRVREVLQEAQLAGVSPADALFDRASIALRVGRLREASDLFAAAIDRDKSSQAAKKGLADAQAAIERGVTERLTRADWLFAQFRFDEAITQWDQALQLLDPSDSRAATARAGIERAKQARAAR